MSDFMPHGHCILWNPTLLSIHVVSDFLIFLSYCSIPLAIYYYLYKRKVKNILIPSLFIIFILSCALTHIFTIWNWWHTNYWLSGYFKIFCALVSSFTAITLWKLMPKALELPGLVEHENLQNFAKQLEKTNSEDSDYFASVVHEIRNHLNVINLSSQVLLTRKNQDEDRKVLKSMILRNGNVLNELINSVLDLSKLKKKTLTPNFENISLENLLSELEYEYKHRAREKNIEFSIEKNEDVPFNIVTDQTRLTQILRNLISNSFKYTEKGFVKLVIEASKHSLNQESITLTFSIKDSGTGIPKEDQEHIFERYTRSKLHKKIEGVGIGLSLSKSLAKLLGGDLFLKESTQQGTLFQLILNTETAKKTSFTKYEDKLEVLDWSGKHFLIADDAKENRILYEIALKDTNAKLNFVENGLEALNEVKKEEFDAILLDIEMPIMDGRTAVKEIKKIKPDSLIIAVTGLTKGMETNLLKEDGFDDYILKPIDLSKFNNTLESHLLQTLKK